MTLLTLPQAARLLGLTHSRLRQLARSGEIACNRLGRVYYTSEDAIAEYRERVRAEEAERVRTRWTGRPRRVL